MPYSINKFEINGWLVGPPKITENSIMVTIGTERYVRSASGGSRIVEQLQVYITLAQAKHVNFDYDLRSKAGDLVYIAGRQVCAFGKLVQRKDGKGIIALADTIKSVMISFPERNKDGVGGEFLGASGDPPNPGYKPANENDMPF
jgi:hypothetical protein